MEPIKSEQRARSLETVQEFVRIVPALPLPANAAEAYGFIRAELERQGEMVGPNNLWIAAHALASGLTLVTNDESEFRRVRGLIDTKLGDVVRDSPGSGDVRSSSSSRVIPVTSLPPVWFTIVSSTAFIYPHT